VDPQFKAGYLRHLSLVDDLADSTVRQYRNRIGVLERITGKSIEQITADDALEIKSMRDRYSSSYRKGLLVTLRSIHDYGAFAGKWERNGISYVKPPKEENETSLPLSEDQAEALMMAARTPAEVRVTHLPTLAGLRIGEASAIRPPHWLPGHLYFRREKTRKLHQLPIHPRLQLARRSILSISPAWPSVLQDAKEALEQRTGITFVTHQLRKTFGQALLDRGADWATVQKLLGHTLGVTGRYADPSFLMQQEALRLLPF
jgi:site-specific recombinase XerD